MRTLSILTVLGLTSFTLADAEGNYITNGGFESPIAGANFFMPIDAGSSALTGWSILSGSVDVVNQGFFPSYEGAQSLDLDGTATAVLPGVIQQSFSTVAGDEYILSFAYSNNPDASSSSALVSVLGSSSDTVFSQAITHSGATRSAMNYVIFTATFTADSSTTTLKFASTDPVTDAEGIVLDAVSVNAVVPEPSSLMLMTIALLGGFGLRRRAKRA